MSFRDCGLAVSESFEEFFEGDFRRPQVVYDMGNGHIPPTMLKDNHGSTYALFDKYMMVPPLGFPDTAVMEAKLLECLDQFPAVLRG